MFVSRTLENMEKARTSSASAFGTDTLFSGDSPRICTHLSLPVKFSPDADGVPDVQLPAGQRRGGDLVTGNRK